LNAHQQRKALLRREWLFTVAVALALLVALVWGGIAKPLGDVLYDHFMRLHGFKSTQDIVIVAVDDRTLSDLGGWPLKRDRYTQLLEALDDDRYRPKVIGFDFLFLDPTPDDPELAKQMLRHNTVLPLEFSIQEDAKQTLSNILPAQPLDSAATIGHINLSFDSDGVIRGVQLANEKWPHFSLALHAKSNSAHPPNLTQSGYRRFRMVDPRVGFPMVSLADAIHNNFTRTLLKDKYVLVGVTAPSLGDRYPTLYSGKNNASTPGVAILASILNASLDQALIQEAPAWVVCALALAPLLAMLQSLLYLRPRYALLLASLMMLAGVALSYALLTLANYWIDPIPFILVAILIQPLWAWRRLEAMVHLIDDKAADLQQFPSTARHNSSIRHSREVVLNYAKLLDHAVASARSELDFLSTVVDEIPDAVAIFDPQDQLLLCNQKIKQLIATEQLEGLHSLADLAQHLHVPLSTLAATAHDDDTHPAPATFQIESLLGPRELLIKTANIASPSGGQLRLIILTDITDLRQSQMQRDRALQFLSHDMRTPVASILSLLRPTPQETSEHIQQRAKISYHAKALLHMMDDFILTISAEASSYKVKQELLDNLLNDAIEQVVDLAQEKNITLSDDSGSSSLFVMAQTRLLVRALVNILFNAVKFSPAGSKVSIQVTNTANQATITVRNPVHAQTDAHDLTPSMPGFGLGLNFVDIVIHKHQGTITRNIPPHGMATTLITLPCTTN